MKSRTAIPFSLSQLGQQPLLRRSSILIKHLTDDAATAGERNLEVICALPFAQSL
jgi:hypothetical protein